MFCMGTLYREATDLRKLVLGLFAYVLLSAVVLAGEAMAEPPYPRQGVRVVDGNISDWNLTKDFFAYMYRAGKAEKEVESWLYLRYDCETSTLYILVRSRPDVPILAEATHGAWIAIDRISKKVVNGAAGVDGTPPDFAWVGLTETSNGKVAYGYEASITLNPGSYALIGHADVIDDDGIQTSATEGSPKAGIAVYVDCAVPVRESTWGAIKSIYR
jgi:hypothetical protein